MMKQEHTNFGDEDGSTGVQKVKRKVQFSRPLEHWREFDKETGELSELKDSKMRGKLTQYCRNVETFTDKNRENSGSENIDCKGGAKTQSITEMIQAFQKRQDRRINALKQAEEKRKDCYTRSKQNVKLASSALHIKQVNKGSLLCNIANCSKLARDGEFLWNFPKESCLIQSYCTYSFSASLSMLTSFNVPPPLPLVCSSRKLYDERLLPTTYESAGRRYPHSKTEGNGLPPVFGKLPTPYIVQLFD